jgi:hypothetical protein
VAGLGFATFAPKHASHPRQVSQYRDLLLVQLQPLSLIIQGIMLRWLLNLLWIRFLIKHQRSEPEN